MNCKIETCKRWLDHITPAANDACLDHVACLDQDIHQCCMQVQKSQEIKMAVRALATLMQYDMS